jgi:hypothetical protein
VKIPKEDFNAIRVGGKTEAIDAAESLESALRANPAFRKWLRTAVAAEATVRERPSSRRK